jgi:hypothetical protein
LAKDLRSYFDAVDQVKRMAGAVDEESVGSLADVDARPSYQPAVSVSEKRGRAIQWLPQVHTTRLLKRRRRTREPSTQMLRPLPGDFVAIELKKDRPERPVAGQLSSYMGWLTQHRADPKGVGVRGIIAAHEITEKLRAAVLPNANIDVYEYRFNVSLTHVSLERSRVRPATATNRRR